jgi:RNA polymerase sigma-70 factor (ECF subfamily)
LAQQESASGASGFGAVVNDHWTPVYKLLLCMSGNTHDAEELTQETFLRALRRIDSFQPGTRMRSWLLRIASNACLDLRRRQKRAKGVPLEEDIPATAPHPGHRIEAAEQNTMLLHAMEGLSEKTRAVFHLRAEESLSFRQIAESLGTTEQAARWHMHHARATLLARLNKYG